MQRPAHQRHQPLPSGQPQQRGQQRQPQRFTQQQPGHLARRRAQHAQQGQVGAALPHGAPQGDEHAQRSGQQQHAGQGFHQLGAHADHAEQAGDFQRGRGGLHLGGGVDEARKRHRRQRGFVLNQRQRHLALFFQDFLVFLVQRGVGFMHLPDRLGGGDDQPVQHRPAGRQHADHGVRRLAMHLARGPQPVRAGQGVAHLQPRAGRHLRAHHGLHGFCPQRTLGQGHLVVADVVGRGAHDAKAAKTVAQADRNELGHLRVGFQRVDGGQRHITGGHVQVKHAGQDQLHRAALGPHHHVNAGQIAFKRGIDLVADQQQQRDGRQPEREQQQVQASGQRTRPQVAPGQGKRVQSITITLYFSSLLFS